MKLKIVYKAIDSLVAFENNSRIHNDEQVDQIAASIVQFGFTNPVLLSNENVIIAGHGRVMAARKLGIDEVPTIILDHLSESQRKALVIADNKLALNSQWDGDLLALEINDIADSGFDVDLLGFSEKEFSKLFDEFKDLKIEEDIKQSEIDSIIIKFAPNKRVSVLNAVKQAIESIDTAMIWASDE